MTGTFYPANGQNGGGLFLPPGWLRLVELFPRCRPAILGGFESPTSRAATSYGRILLLLKIVRRPIGTLPR